MKRPHEKAVNDQFLTSDFLLTTFLLARKMQLTGAKKSNGSITFEFQDRDACEDLESELLFGSDLVSARELYEKMRLIKRMIHTDRLTRNPNCRTGG